MRVRWKCNQAYTSVSISISFSTFVTPGASQACFSASFFSAQERTLPLSVTVPPSTSTSILSESKVALLTKAALIFLLISVGVTLGVILILLITPFTPSSFSTALRAAFFWYSHSTFPSSVTQPSSTLTFILSFGTSTDHFNAL